MSTTLQSLLFVLVLPVLALHCVGLVVHWATASDRERAQLLRAQGLSQATIAARLGCSRHRVRCYLAAA